MNSEYPFESQAETESTFRLPGDPPARDYGAAAIAATQVRLVPPSADPWGYVRHAVPPLRLGRESLDDGLGERRRSPRFCYSDGRLPPNAIVVPGQPVIAVNLSETGMLVEASWNIRPNRLVEVRLQFPGHAATVLAEIVRSYVTTLDRSRGIRYRAAVAFTSRIALPREADLFQRALKSLSASA
jgi:hypothetical protein